MNAAVAKKTLNMPPKQAPKQPPKETKPPFKEPRTKWKNSEAKKPLCDDLVDGEIPLDDDGDSEELLLEWHLSRDEHKRCDPNSLPALASNPNVSQRCVPFSCSNQINYSYQLPLILRNTWVQCECWKAVICVQRLVSNPNVSQNAAAVRSVFMFKPN